MAVNPQASTAPALPQRSFVDDALRQKEMQELNFKMLKQQQLEQVQRQLQQQLKLQTQTSPGVPSIPLNQPSVRAPVQAVSTSSSGFPPRYSPPIVKTSGTPPVVTNAIPDSPTEETGIRKPKARSERTIADNTDLLTNYNLSSTEMKKEYISPTPQWWQVIDVIEITQEYKESKNGFHQGKYNKWVLRRAESKMLFLDVSNDLVALEGVKSKYSKVAGQRKIFLRKDAYLIMKRENEEIYEKSKELCQSQMEKIDRDKGTYDGVVYDMSEKNLLTSVSKLQDLGVCQGIIETMHDVYHATQRKKKAEDEARDRKMKEESEKRWNEQKWKAWRAEQDFQRAVANAKHPTHSNGSTTNDDTERRKHTQDIAATEWAARKAKEKGVTSPFFLNKF